MNSRCKQVPGAVNRTNKRRVRCMLAKFPAYLPHQYIDVAVVGIPFAIPDLVHQLVPGEDLTCVFYQCQ